VAGAVAGSRLPVCPLAPITLDLVGLRCALTFACQRRRCLAAISVAFYPVLLLQIAGIT